MTTDSTTTRAGSTTVLLGVKRTTPESEPEVPLLQQTKGRVLEILTEAGGFMSERLVRDTLPKRHRALFTDALVELELEGLVVQHGGGGVGRSVLTLAGPR